MMCASLLRVREWEVVGESLRWGPGIGSFAASRSVTASGMDCQAISEGEGSSSACGWLCV